MDGRVSERNASESGGPRSGGGGRNERTIAKRSQREVKAGALARIRRAAGSPRAAEGSRTSEFPREGTDQNRRAFRRF